MKSLREQLPHIIAVGKRELAPPLLLKLLKRAKYLRRQYFGLNDLDRQLEKYLNYNDGYFVELGANDGVSQSNTLYYERYRNWRGILVEPIPHNYLLCREVRSPRTQVFFNACTSFEYKERFVAIAYSNLMSTPIGLESDVPNPLEHAKEGRRFLRPSDENFIFGALARPLDGILTEANAPRVIDLLSLDVEGAEIEVLKGIDHGKYRFNIMCIESRSKENLSAYLGTVGYRLVEQLSHHDYVFCPDSDQSRP